MQGQSGWWGGCPVDSGEPRGKRPAGRGPGTVRPDRSQRPSGASNPLPPGGKCPPTSGSPGQWGILPSRWMPGHPSGLSPCGGKDSEVQEAKGHPASGPPRLHCPYVHMGTSLCLLCPPWPRGMGAVEGRGASVTCWMALPAQGAPPLGPPLPAPFFSRLLSGQRQGQESPHVLCISCQFQGV